MASEPFGPDPCDSLVQARRINESCERFESAWRSGAEPRIEDFVSSATPEDGILMLRELLALEIELRQARGEALCAADYEERFPGSGALINSVLEEAEAIGRRPHSSSETLASTVKEDDRSQTIDFGDVHKDNSMRTGCPVAEEQLGDYVLLEEIARGGMGVVYKARQVSLKRNVALKMILTGIMATPAERERFRREAEWAAHLSHRNIVPIIEVRDESGVLFFSMEFVEGGNLAQRVFQFKSDPMAAARLIETLAKAVHYAHGKGFIHCDLKPSNILIDLDNEPHITDFGLARRASDDSSLTATGAILGTPSYMAPEQASGQRKLIGAATGVWTGGDSLRALDRPASISHSDHDGNGGPGP
jgi:serine/threonine-protein kinase